MQSTVATLVVAAVMTTAAIAPAQEASPVAEALYREGRRLLEANRIPEACIKFAESQRTEPAIGTLLNLANCHEKEGKWASAWAEFTQAAESAKLKGQTERVTFAREQAAAIEKKLHTLAVDVKTPSTGMTIRLDDRPLGNAAWGTLLPIDPGLQRLSVSAAKKKTWVRDVTIPDGPGASRISVPALADDEKDASPPPVVVDPPPIRIDEPTSDRGNATRRTVGLVLTGTGILALGTGVFLGVRSILLDNQADSEAGRAEEYQNTYPKNAQTQRDASDRDRDAASTNRTIGIIAGGAGLVAIGAGIYFLVTSKDAKPSHGNALRLTPVAGPHMNGASLSLTY